MCSKNRPETMPAKPLGANTGALAERLGLLVTYLGDERLCDFLPVDPSESPHPSHQTRLIQSSTAKGSVMAAVPRSSVITSHLMSMPAMRSAPRPAARTSS